MNQDKTKVWEVISSSVLHRTDWIEIVEDRCVFDSHEFVYTYTRRVDQGPLIIPEESLGNLWMVRQYRHPIRKSVWQFPAEGKHEGESWLDTSQRGLAEELGKEALTWIELGMIHPDPGGLAQESKVFLARELEDLTDEVPSSDLLEELELKCFSLDDIDGMIETGEICDGWTFSGLYLYRAYLEKNS